MDDQTRARLHDTTLAARKLLVTEARGLLEGVYGLGRDGRFASGPTLPAVQALDEVRLTRKRLEKYLADEAAAGLRGAEAVDKLVKEVAFTHLNRLVAFKMMESRRLIRGALDRYHESNAFKFYLAEHQDDLARYEAGSLPQDALGEGPRDTAYRRFLLAQCAEMASQIHLLFDPDNLSSRLFPRPRALRDIVDMLNATDLKNAWSNDEAIGWVYQYFNEEEKAAVFVKLNKGQKVQAGEIPAATQLFTPRWIVRTLVHNTLGRLWLRMHPDSNLRTQLDYLVPIEEVPPAPMRPVREITLLDPACGTMHFGLVAFDLFAAMYREEIEHAGEPGWPAVPSVANIDDIPAAVIEHNLYGIDIDLRAVQLSALTLLLKARSLNSKVTISDHNLACAEVLLLNGERLNAFLEEFHLTRPIYKRLIRGLWSRLKDANQLGSLLRLEADLAEIIAEEQRNFEAPMLPGFSSEQFETEAGRQEFWNIIEGQILQAFDEFARQHAAKGKDERYFTGEATKGLRLLNIMLGRYDVVVANPPYMHNRNMSAVMSEYLRKHYPTAKADLYAAFIDRCQGMLAPGGRVGMITQQSFMFISSYEALRAQLRGTVAIETMIHVGPRAFAEIGGEKVNTTLFALRREQNTVDRTNAIGTYFRLVKEPDARGKQQRFEQALARLASGQDDPIIYRYRQGDFDAIDGAPWVYWITPGLRRLFNTLPPLKEISPPKMGMGTRNNVRFLRYWWEVGAKAIDFHCTSVADSIANKRSLFPYMKGGPFKRWYGNQERIVNFFDAGVELKEEQLQKYPYIGNNTGWIVPNEEFYFHRGITWTDLTSGRFSARLSPGGFIFDVKGSSAFPEDIPLVLALLNSSFAHYALNLLNPTVSFQVGDLARLPVPATDSPLLVSLVDQAIMLARHESQEDETTYDFIAPPAWPTGPQDFATRANQLATIERQIDEEVYRLYGIGPEDRAAIEAELSEPTATIDGDEAPETSSADVSAGDDEVDGSGEQLSMPALAQRWVSYAVGIVLGRFQPGVKGAIGRACFACDVAAALRDLVDDDGIAVVDDGHPDDLVPRVERALELMLGPEQAEQVIAAATGGKRLAVYLTRDFFKQHVQQYRKRPVYWLLQSPRRTYSLLVFHERLTTDSLYLIMGSRYLGGKVNAARARVEELRAAAQAAPQGRERQRLEGELDGTMTVLCDLEEFSRLLGTVTSQVNERGEVVGWRPEIDDGVLINLAPLHTLMPAWSAEPKKAWEALKRGEYDWSHTAMRYWPERVRAACAANRSYAIAHGLTTGETGVSDAR